MDSISAFAFIFHDQYIKSATELVAQLNGIWGTEVNARKKTIEVGFAHSY